MSYLANAISELLAEHDMTATDLINKTGINKAQVSRWINGLQISIKPKNIKRLARGFSQSPSIEGRLLYAHLKDECQGDGARFITLEFNGDFVLREEPTPYKTNLPPAVQKDIDIIVAHGRNRHIRALLKAIAGAAKVFSKVQ